MGNSSQFIPLFKTPLFFSFYDNYVAWKTGISLNPLLDTKIKFVQNHCCYLLMMQMPREVYVCAQYLVSFTVSGVCRVNSHYRPFSFEFIDRINCLMIKSRQTNRQNLLSMQLYLTSDATLKYG